MLHVTCAIIEHNNKILIFQRSERMKLPLKWKFQLYLYPFLCKWTGGLWLLPSIHRPSGVDKSELQEYDWRMCRLLGNYYLLDEPVVKIC
ncbi:hypothetical protein [Sphingobacterium sp. SGR-19]|uniref:hypothetical protein n=1 Tax=Sphingobacterium sp. SGR-19 TaxID=2710886 RepID=UPI001F0E7FAF|nr:hypothetical protein [Sphingobacterium sp. SGR-19]